MSKDGRGLALPVVLALVLFASTAACARRTGGAASPADFRAAVSGGEWHLIELAGQPAALGAGGRRATLAFDADTARAGGFSGCNRWGAGYTVSGDSLRFTAPFSTKMACSDGMELERGMLGAIEATRRYTTRDGELRLLGPADESVARFERAAP